MHNAKFPGVIILFTNKWDIDIFIARVLSVHNETFSCKNNKNILFYFLLI
jgi:hypothetical protein